MATNGNPSKQFNQPTKRYVQVMDLKNDSELIRRYREAHDKEHFWHEIGQGIKEAGIIEDCLSVWRVNAKSVKPKK